MDSPAQLLRRHGLRPKKSWGQCFLSEPAFLARIVDAAGLAPPDTVVEIGAGLGTLTARLAARAARVIAIERDRDLAPILRRELASFAQVEVVEANALGFAFAGLAREPLVVVGNLPYNIASPLLFHLIEERAAIRSATIMLQRELAARLVAAPGSAGYGAPSVLVRQVADARIRFAVPAAAFVPRPRVDSAVVGLAFLREPRFPVGWDELRAVVRLAFRFRRKTLRRALAAEHPAAQVELALAAAELDGRRRGETLELEEFARLARALADGERGAAP